MSLEPPLDPNNIQTAQFVISNDGLVTLNNLQGSFFVFELRDNNNNRVGGELGAPREFQLPKTTLEPGAKMTVGFQQRVTFGVPVANFDVALGIRFTSILTFWRHTRIFRFSAAKQSDGTIRLQQQPMDDAHQQIIDAYFAEK